MIIAGHEVRAAATFDVIDPARGERVASAPECSAEQFAAAVDAAGAAASRWSTDLGARREALAAAAAAVRGVADELALLLTAEQGRPLARAKEEALGAAMWLKYHAQLELTPEVIQDDEHARIELVRQPHGVVGAITPWNFPLLIAAGKIAPALLAGNTLVLKPSPFTPLATLRLAAVLDEVLPPGVLNVVSGGDELGEWMTGHPSIRKISFTGSVETGKRVAQRAGEDLKRVTLELGGNDPAVVLDDADPQRIARKLFWGAFINTGQACQAVKRVYVPSALHDALVDALCGEARAVAVGDGRDSSTQLGPLTTAPQLARVTELVHDALDDGATAATGGRRIDRPGYFFEPTILTGVRDGTRIVDEEQFGPVLPVVPYDDLNDAIAAANDTHYGLAASVWSSDPGRAAEVATGLEAGTLGVNAHPLVTPHVPVGGHKWSGIGVENGPWGLAGYTDLQIRHLPPRRDPATAG
jgi:acyl-CoA reductase-like NAD-dependent aldehyde dehydrogenase